MHTGEILAFNKVKGRNRSPEPNKEEDEVPYQDRGNICERVHRQESIMLDL